MISLPIGDANGQANPNANMQRFYLPPERCRPESLRLDGREAHHALHVLRLKRGERVTVLDGAGGEFLGEVAAATKDAVTLTLTERVVTQLDGGGAEYKREKWQQVAIEAIKQCGAAWLPKVEAPTALKDFLARGEKPELTLVGSLQTERRHPREIFAAFQTEHGRRPSGVGVWIGPEGDFTLAELQAIEAAGAQPVTLGKLTLRVETAAIYCLSFLNYELSA